MADSGQYEMTPEQQKIDRELILQRYRDFLTSWRPPTPEDGRLVRKTLRYAIAAHEGKRRLNGEPFICHPLDVARIVNADIGLSTTSVVCALLHDVVEDTRRTLEEIEDVFGIAVARIIHGLTKVEGIIDTARTSNQTETFKRIIFSLTDDIRVVLIKLADRLNNMRTLEFMPRAKQLKIASETLELYAPIAQRLGLNEIKTELEDLSFKYINPEAYADIAGRLEETEYERNQFVASFLEPIKNSLQQHGIKSRILNRNKSVYSIWEKMSTTGVQFSDVDDVFFIRIIVDVPQEQEKFECWRVYSIITNFYRPKLDRLKDWISIPKSNGYEALHVTVMSPPGKWVEIQIRSIRMDEIAEKGYVAHLKYKSSSNAETNLDRWLKRIKDLLKNTDEEGVSFVEGFKGSLYKDEITVFTIDGELRTLPKNSTVLDFAYAIHSEVGNTCILGEVNNQQCPINHVLSNGDRIKIITSPSQVPKDFWLKYVITTRAKTYIRNYLREEQRKQAAEGEQKLSGYLGSLSIDFNPENLKTIQDHYKYPSLDDLYLDVAADKISLKDLRECYQQLGKGSWISNIIKFPLTLISGSREKNLSESILEQISQKSITLTVGDDVRKISYEISDCCLPIPGDEVIGVVDPAGSIQIHRAICKDAILHMTRHGNSTVKVRWTDNESVSFLTGLSITAVDTKGFIKDVVRIIAENMDLNIRSFHLDTDAGNLQATIMLYVYGLKNMNDLVRNLKKYRPIKRINRISEFKDFKF